MKKTFIIYLWGILLLVASCKPEIDSFTPQSGEKADFSSYISIGNSITSGFSDGALYKSGQEYSFPNIIAQQLKYVGAGEFKQPIIETENGVSVVDASVFPPILGTKLSLQYSQNSEGKTSLGPKPIAPKTPQAELAKQLFTNINDQGPFNNIGIPGAKTIDFPQEGFGLRNPFFNRIAKNPAGDRLISEIGKVNPTFFSLFIGNNDALGFAVTGGTSDELTPIAGAEGIGFRASYQAILDTLQARGNWKNGKMQGILATVPDIKALPFFTTVPFNLLVLDDQNIVDQLNAAYQPYNALMTSLGVDYRISFKLGPNPVVIADPDMNIPDQFAAYKFRQMETSELILLTIPQDSIKMAGWGSQKPITDKYTLRKVQVQKINERIDEFNAVIKELALANDLAIIHPNDFLMKAVAGQFVQDGVHFSSKFITGNLFSLDGIHMTPQGNALMANNFIKVINQKYGSIIPIVPIATYPAVKFP